MNHDHQLQRLFRAAASAEETLPPMTYRLEMTVLSAWRSRPAEMVRPEENSFWLRAVACAALVSFLCFIPLLNQTKDPLTESIRLAEQTTPWEEN